MKCCYKDIHLSRDGSLYPALLYFIASLLEEYRIFIFYNNFRSYLVLNILLSQGAEHNMLLKHQTLRDIFCFELSKVNFGWRIQPEATELGPSSTSRVNTI